MSEHELSKRLRIKAGMIELGERIAWGSDSALMREAANLIDQLAAKPLQDALDESAECQAAGYPTKIMPEGLTPRPDGLFSNPLTDP